MQQPPEHDEAVKSPSAPDATYVQVDSEPPVVAVCPPPPAQPEPPSQSPPLQAKPLPQSECPLPSQTQPEPPQAQCQPPQAQPAPQSPLQNVIATGEWTSGLCGCFDFLVPNCLMAWCCPCVTFAQISHRLRLTSYSTALLFFCIVVLGVRGLCWTTNNNAVSTILSIFGLLCWILQTAAIMYIRRHIRERFHIDGDSGSDCCIACCCSCCAAAQMATHVKSFRRGDCSFAAPDQLPAYQ